MNHENRPGDSQVPCPTEQEKAYFCCINVGDPKLSTINGCLLENQENSEKKISLTFFYWSQTVPSDSHNWNFLTI